MILRENLTKLTQQCREARNAMSVSTLGVWQKYRMEEFDRSYSFYLSNLDKFPWDKQSQENAVYYISQQLLYILELFTYRKNIINAPDFNKFCEQQQPKIEEFLSDHPGIKIPNDKHQWIFPDGTHLAEINNILQRINKERSERQKKEDEIKTSNEEQIAFMLQIKKEFLEKRYLPALKKMLPYLDKLDAPCEEELKLHNELKSFEENMQNISDKIKFLNHKFNTLKNKIQELKNQADHASTEIEAQEYWWKQDCGDWGRSSGCSRTCVHEGYKTVKKSVPDVKTREDARTQLNNLIPMLTIAESELPVSEIALLSQQYKKLETECQPIKDKLKTFLEPKKHTKAIRDRLHSCEFDEKSNVLERVENARELLEDIQISAKLFELLQPSQQPILLAMLKALNPSNENRKYFLDALSKSQKEIAAKGWPLEAKAEALPAMTAPPSAPELHPPQEIEEAQPGAAPVEEIQDAQHGTAPAEEIQEAKSETIPEPSAPELQVEGLVQQPIDIGDQTEGAPALSDKQLAERLAKLNGSPRLFQPALAANPAPKKAQAAKCVVLFS